MSSLSDDVEVNNIYLQGWGESMLLTDLLERIRWFKVQKCISEAFLNKPVPECCRNCPEMEGS